MKCPHIGRPPNQLATPAFKPPLSRREFLKIAEIVSIGTAMNAVPGFSNLVSASISAGEPSDEEVEAALEIARDSDMFQEVLSGLQALGIEFDISPDFVRLPSWQGSFLGLVLKHSRSPSPRMGADLILATHLSNETLSTLQSIAGWSLLDLLVLNGSLSDLRKPPREEIRNPLVHYDEPPRMIRPRLENLWSFFRPDSPPWRPEDASVEIGWPPETPDTHYWHFGGCNACAWENDQGVWVYRCVQILEERLMESEQRRIVDLQYSQ
jgi:hypothetical protein